MKAYNKRVINSQIKKASLRRVRQQGCIRELELFEFVQPCSKFCLLDKSHTGMRSDMVSSCNFQCNVAWQFVRIMLFAMQHLRRIACLSFFGNELLEYRIKYLN